MIKRNEINKIVAKDPIEETDEYKTRAQELEEELSELMKNHSRFGSCHFYWANKKRILKEKYGIEWKSPAELNPHVCFD